MVKKTVNSTAIVLASLSLVVVSFLTASPSHAMSSQTETPVIEMYALSDMADQWLTQHSGPFRGVVVLQDHEAVTLLYHRGLKPTPAADHEDFVTTPRIKFYRASETRWEMETEHVPGQVQIRTLPAQMEQWVEKKAGEFRAVMVLKLDGTIDVYHPRTHTIQAVRRYTVRVSQPAKAKTPVANVSYHRLPDEAIVWGCVCFNGTEYYW